jgi:hypothetical protein
MTVIMPFGKYKGESIENIIASDPAYHLWACNNNVYPLCEYPCTHVPSANKRKKYTASQYGYDHCEIYEYGEN